LKRCSAPNSRGSAASSRRRLSRANNRTMRTPAPSQWQCAVHLEQQRLLLLKRMMLMKKLQMIGLVPMWRRGESRRRPAIASQMNSTSLSQRWHSHISARRMRRACAVPRHIAPPRLVRRQHGHRRAPRAEVLHVFVANEPAARRQSARDVAHAEAVGWAAALPVKQMRILEVVLVQTVVHEVHADHRLADAHSLLSRACLQQQPEWRRQGAGVGGGIGSLTTRGCWEERRGERITGVSSFICVGA